MDPEITQPEKLTFSKTSRLNYKPSDRIKATMNAKDVKKLRIVLVTDLNTNLLSIDELIQSVIYCSEKVSLFDEYAYDNVMLPIENDPTHWNAKYFDTYMVFLRNNFSAERLLNLINVKEHLRKNKVSGFKRIILEKPTEVGMKNSNNNDSNYNQPDWVKKALIIGGISASILIGLLCIFRGLK